MASFSRITKSMESSHATALLEQKNRALKEMEDYVKQSNAKYNAMLNERMGIEEDLRAKLKANAKNADQSAEFERRLAAAAADAQKHLDREVARVKGGFEGQLQKMNAELDNSTRRLVDAQNQAKADREREAAAAAAAAKRAADEAARAAADAAAALDKARAECDSLRRSLAASEANAASLQKQMDTLLSQSKLGADAQALAWAQERAALQSQLHEKSEALQASQTREAAAARERSVLESTIKRHAETIARLEKELAAQSASLERERKASEKLQADLKARDKELEALRAAKDSGLSSAAQGLAALQARVRDLEESLARAQSNLATREKELASLQEEQVQLLQEKRDLDVLCREQAATITELRAQLAQATQALQTAQDRCADLESQLADSERSKQDLAGETGAQLRSLQEAHSALQSAHAATQSDLDSSRDQVSSLQRALSQLQSALAEREASIASLESELAAERARANSDSGASSRALAALQSSLASVTSERDALLAARARLDESLAKLQRQMEEQRMDAARAESALRAQIDALGRQHAQERHAAQGAAAGELDRLRKEFDSFKSSSSELAARVASEHTSALVALRAQHDKDLAALRSTLEAQAAQREQALRSTLEESRRAAAEAAADAATKLRSSLADLEARLNAEMDSATQAHLSALATLRSSSDKALSLQKSQAEESLAELKEKHKLALHEAGIAGASREAALARERDGFAAELRELRTRFEQQSAVLQSTQSDLESTRETAARRQVQLQSEMAAALDDLSQRGRDDLARAARLAQEELSRLAASHAQAQQSWSARESDLSRALAALQYRFDNREPRPEDVARIRELEEYALAAEKARRKAVEEAKYYKLELLNREENYNKTFGRSPSVGVPVMPSAQGAAAGNATGKAAGGLSVRVGGGSGGANPLSTRGMPVAASHHAGSAAAAAASPHGGIAPSASGSNLVVPGRRTSSGPMGMAAGMAQSPSAKGINGATEEEKSASRTKRN